MDVVRHYYGGVQTALPVVDMSAGFQSETRGQVWEMPSLMGGESDEEGFIVFLDVG